LYYLILSLSGGNTNGIFAPAYQNKSAAKPAVTQVVINFTYDV